MYCSTLLKLLSPPPQAPSVSVTAAAAVPATQRCRGSAQALNRRDAPVRVPEHELDEPFVGRKPLRARAAAVGEALLLELRLDHKRAEAAGGGLQQPRADHLRGGGHPQNLVIATAPRDSPPVA